MSEGIALRLQFSTRIAEATLLIALLAPLGACASSPTTQHVSESGHKVTVEWRDYPAYAGTDADLVLAGPTVEETPMHAPALLDEVMRELSTAFEDETGQLTWQQNGDDGWFPMSGNGYGGDSMLQTYNSPTWEAGAVIARDRWQELVDVAARVAADFGLETRRKDEFEPGFDRWLHSEALLRGDVEWLTVSVQDASLDAAALHEAEEHGWLVAGISISYGISTISDEHRAAFEQRTVPFRGLDMPEATHSD